jgi:hypothetical protein
MYLYVLTHAWPRLVIGPLQQFCFAAAAAGKHSCLYSHQCFLDEMHSSQALSLLVIALLQAAHASSSIADHRNISLCNCAWSDPQRQISYLIRKDFL